jgi:hypothetical protein
MNQSPGMIRRILGPDGPDAGCERSLELLDQVIEADRAGRAVRDAFPDIAVHLEACPDCREDYDGLRELVRSHDGGESANMA